MIQPGKFSEEWPTELRKELVDSKKCAIDQINNHDPHQRTLTFRSGEILNLAGWAVPKSDERPAALYVQLVSPTLTYSALAHTRTERADVNQYFKLDAAWNTGFNIQAVQTAEPGEYQLEILQPGTEIVTQCATRIVIKIEPGPRGG